MSYFKRAAAVVLALAMALSLAACGGSTDDRNQIKESTAGKDLVASVTADSDFSLNCYRRYSFNPLIATNHSNQLVCGLVYENMVDLDDNFNVIYNIIISGEPIDEEGKQWKFKLDTSHTFSDGTPVTGKDLRYSLERAINADRYYGRFASFQGVGYTEDEIQVSLGIGDTEFIKLLNIPVIKSGSHNDDYPPGSGPYTYNEDYTALIPNEYFWNRTVVNEEGEEPTKVYGEPPVDIIYLKEYSSMEENLSAFESGVIDVVLNDPSSSTNLGYAGTNESHSFATTNMHYVVVNQRTLIASDAAFRYALNFAFDRANFVSLLNGNGVASTVPMYPTCSLYPTQYANTINYNLQSVKAVFENAGLKDYDEDGILEYLTPGGDVELKFIVCSDSSAKAGVAERFVADMASIGLTIDLQELPWDDYKAALYEGDFDLYYGEVKLRNNFDITELLQRRPKDADEYSSNLNFSGNTDDNYVNYINAYLSASSFKKPTAYRELCEYVVNTGALITIGFEKQQLITRRGVCRGISPNAGNPLYDFANWTITFAD